MKIKITKAITLAWYSKHIGDQFEVKDKIFRSSSGDCYQLADSYKGILLQDCKVIDDYPTLIEDYTEKYPTLITGYIK